MRVKCKKKISESALARIGHGRRDIWAKGTSCAIDSEQQLQRSSGLCSTFLAFSDSLPGVLLFSGQAMSLEAKKKRKRNNSFEQSAANSEKKRIMEANLIYCPMVGGGSLSLQFKSVFGSIRSTLKNSWNIREKIQLEPQCKYLNELCQNHCTGFYYWTNNRSIRLFADGII